MTPRQAAIFLLLERPDVFFMIVFGISQGDSPERILLLYTEAGVEERFGLDLIKFASDYIHSEMNAIEAEYRKAEAELE